MQQHEDDAEYDMINFIYVILSSLAISKGSAYHCLTAMLVCTVLHTVTAWPDLLYEVLYKEIE